MSALRRRCSYVPAFCLPMNRQPRWMFPCRNRCWKNCFCCARTYGTAIVLVAHNIGVIGAMADRVLVMQDGRTVEYGETQTVLHDPQASYTRMLLSAVPRLRRA